MIPYSRQWIDEDDIQQVVKVLRSDWITQGSIIDQFEKELAAYCGAKYAVAVSSGTAALHLACLAAGIKTEDEVILSPITFVASANCVIYCGGKPVFADIDSETINIDPKEIKKNINKKTRAVIPVHFAGLPCEMEEISKIAKEHNLIIIEDACHALGTEYKAESGEWVKVGSCYHSDMTVFSFHPVKSITTGEGGAITTNDPELFEKLKMLRNHGITKNPDEFVNNNIAASLNPNYWYYEMQMLGFNYRITDFQCALGLSQLGKLDNFILARKKIAQQYDSLFSNIHSVKLPSKSDRFKPAYHLYVVQVEKRNEIYRKLISEGVGVQVHYIPVYLHPYYQQNFKSYKRSYPSSENYFKQAISFPIYYSLQNKDVIRIAKLFIKLLETGTA